MQLVWYLWIVAKHLSPQAQWNKKEGKKKRKKEKDFADTVAQGLDII